MKKSRQYKREISELKLALASFSTNQTGAEIKAVTGRFVTLIEEPASSRYTKSCRRFMYHAADDFRGLLYAMHMFNTSLENRQDDGSHAIAARAHARLFLSDFREILDHMLSASLILWRREIRSSPGKFGKKYLNNLLKRNGHRPSFGSFVKELQKDQTDAEISFPPLLIRLWLKSAWLNDVGDIRDGITHAGLFLAVNNEDSAGIIRLETSERKYPLKRLNLPSTFYEYENTAVAFRLFSGLYCGRLLFFLNTWSAEMTKYCRFEPTSRGYSGLGCTTFFTNINLALKNLEEAHVHTF